MDKLRRCKGKTSVYENGKWHEETFELGYFHGFGSNYEDFGDNGVGNYTVAVVELPDGRVVMPVADNITFIDRIESDSKEGSPSGSQNVFW